MTTIVDRMDVVVEVRQEVALAGEAGVIDANVERPVVGEVRRLSTGAWTRTLVVATVVATTAAVAVAWSTDEAA